MRHRYLRPALTMPQIYLYRAPIDFRKTGPWPAALVEQQLGHNPFTGALYAFTNRRRNKIKCPDVGGQRLCSSFKALARRN